MLLERIEIDSCGSLERIHLGPFSHGANVVIGRPGAGKTATYEFVRNVLLGPDRHWHHGLYGRVVWANRDGLWHCRREADGTIQGRYKVTYEPRGAFQSHYQSDPSGPWEKSLKDGFPFERNFELGRNQIAAFVAPPVGLTVDNLLDVCEQTGLNTETVGDSSWELNRIKDRLTELDCKLEKEREEDESLGSLQDRRQALLDQLAHAEVLERTPPAESTKRQRIAVRLADCQDEIQRLRLQESDLRRTIAAIENELATLSFSSRRQDSRLPIAQLRRLQLEGIDRQLVRLRQSVREIQSWLREGERLAGRVGVSYSLEFRGASDPAGTVGSVTTARARLAIVRRQLDWFVREFQRPEFFNEEGESRYLGTEKIWGRREEESYQITTGLFDQYELGGILSKIQELSKSLARAEQNGVATGVYEDQLMRAEEVLNSTIRQLIDSRDLLLKRIASEHQLSMRELTEAYGDWHYCQDQPHLYQWLLSDTCPPSLVEGRDLNLRRERLELEHRELLDELSRTANRLDDSVREAKHLQQVIDEIPVYLPVVVDQKHRDWLKSELATVERRIRWWEGRQSLEEERRQLIRRLESFSAQWRGQSGLLSLASRYLDSFWQGQIGSRYGNHNIMDSLRELRTGRVSNAEYQSLLLAIRMAAVEMLGKKGTSVPVIVDELTTSGLSEPVLDAMAETLGRFTSAGHQLLLFTAHRSFAERMRRHGATVMPMESAKYYHMRYREVSEPRYLGAVKSSGSEVVGINRELDMAWRESHGVFDDPYWYRTERPRTYARRNAVDVDRPRHSIDRPVVDVVEVEDREAMNRVSRGPASPFYLSHSSPVDQAPSIDAMAAARLRSLGIHSVGELLTADCKDLSRRLKLVDVDELIIRQWQDEAKMVCEVPQMRNFDARVLVGCGVTDSTQLSRMHPGKLLEKVEAFLATERGRQILRSGTSYELSRITAWIAAAGRPKRSSERVTRSHGPARSQQEPMQSKADYSHDERRAERRHPHVHAIPAVKERKSIEQRKGKEERNRVQQRDRFYLELHSPIVDAPSIGPKTAERLEAAGYRTVQDFLDAQPDAIAKRLRNRKITTQMILDWQRQSLLVCRVPHMRGHDAQLLVGVDVVTAEQLAQSDPSELFELVSRYSRTGQGKRYLRGSKAPDRAEVLDWIQWSQRSRSMRKVA